ncbi:MAG: TlpA family protein disulfide reductase [Solirubrobacteraceae bacterium]
MSDEHPPPDEDAEAGGAPLPRRLDPLAAARAAKRPDAQSPPASTPTPPPKTPRIEADRVPGAPRGGPRLQSTPPVIDVRRYQRRVAYIGVTLVLLISLFLFVENGVNTPGVGVGHYLHRFVAPLATGHINLPANANPHCNPAHPAAHALNMCNRQAIVLAFFVTGDGDCTKTVDILQRVAPQFRRIQFAALAAGGDLGSTKPLVRSHHWTIPVGIDSDARVAALYGVEFCPMVEIARPGGLVVQRLIGDRWNNAGRLAAQVRKYLSSG